MAETFDLNAYMNRSIGVIIRTALKASLRNPRAALFLARQTLAQKRAARRRGRREASGQHIPPFLIASIADRCNLACKGCYFHANRADPETRAGTGCHVTARPRPLTASRWGELFREADSLGVSFILLAGGEPLLNRPVLELAAQVKNIVFPVFTNGTLFDAAALALFSRSRNLLPVFSLEGDETVTDAWRGAGTYARAVAAMAELKRRGVLFGASITVTTENAGGISSAAYVDALAALGCTVVFWVEYVPVADGTQALALGEAERSLLAGRQAELRSRHPGLIILAFPGDERFTGGCLAAGRGFFHISTNGGAEPCPFSPFSDTSLHEASLEAALASPLFRRLGAEGILMEEHLGGCLLFAKEAEVRAMAVAARPDCTHPGQERIMEP